jgi:hypothetical protein
VYQSVISAGGIDAAMYQTAYDSGYGEAVPIPKEETLKEIQDEIANGADHTLTYFP